MPNYRVTIDGHDYLVEIVNLAERPVRAIVNGQMLEVDAVSIPEMPQEEAAPAGAPRAQALPPRPVTPPAQLIAPAAPPAGVPGGSEIKAPLPGTIVGINVSVGDRVAHGQELCVLEAMKMNNPIRAAHSGVVSEIRVSIGQQVQHGTILLMIAEA